MAAATACVLVACGEDPSSWSRDPGPRGDRAPPSGPRGASNPSAAQGTPSALGATGRPAPDPTPSTAEHRAPGGDATPLFRYPTFAAPEPSVLERSLREDDAGNGVAHGTFDDGELAFDVVLGVRLQARDRPVPVDKLDYRLALPAGQAIPYVGRVILWRAKAGAREGREAREHGDAASPWESRPLPGARGPVAGEMIVVSEGFVPPPARATWESALPAIVKARVSADETASLLFEDLRRPEADPQRYKLLVPVKPRGDAFLAEGLRGREAPLLKGAYRVRVRGLGPAVLAGDSESITKSAAAPGSPGGPSGSTAPQVPPGNPAGAPHSGPPGAPNARDAGSGGNGNAPAPAPAAGATMKFILPSAAAPGRLSVVYESRRGAPTRTLRIASRHDKAVDFSFHVVHGGAEGATAARPFAHGVLAPGKQASIGLPRAGEGDAMALRYDDEAVFLELPDLPSSARDGATARAAPPEASRTRSASGGQASLPY